MRTAMTIALLLGIGGCTQPNPNAQVSASLTSSQPMAASRIAPLAHSAELLVTVVSVRAHVVPPDVEQDQQKSAAHAHGQGNETASADEEDGHWFTVFSGSRQLDLLNVAADQAFLGSVSVPAGRVTQMRLVLSSITLVVDGQSIAVSCPSCSESGLEIVAGDDMMVSAGGHVMLTLDVDVGASLTLANGELVLQPVIRLSEAEDDRR